VRLTEFEHEHKDGFVSRLDKETTSFFFTNIPEEVQVVDLWSLFAKFGRVGEVYIPMKRDKRGNRFGFVKYKDVNNVEALASRLEEVWVGSYKIRVNLARFGRNSLKSVTDNKIPTPPLDDVATQPAPFKQALLKGHGGKTSPAVALVEVDVVPDFLQTLEGSYVGKLNSGVEVRAVQTKLWLAGLHEVRVVKMGGDLVLLFNNNGEEARGPWCKKGWWGGLLYDIKRWTPNLVSSKRVIWVNMLGIPLHGWGEKTFKALADRYGSYISIDAVTRNRCRLDMARVKMEVPLWERVDATVKLVVQGAAYWVKLVEEGGRDVGGEENEDQLCHNETGSSCASGGQAVAMVVLDGLDGVDTDSEASDNCQRVDALRGQVSCKSKANKGVVGECGEKSAMRAENTMVIPSIDPLLTATGDKPLANPHALVRGSPSLVGVDRERQTEVGQALYPSHIAQSWVQKAVKEGQVAKEGQVGSDEGQLELSGSDQVIEDVGLAENPDLGPSRSPVQVGEVSLDGPTILAQQKSISKAPMIEILDNLLVQAGHNLGGGGNFSELSDSAHSNSSSNAQQNPDSSTDFLGKRKNQCQRKSQIPFSTLLGPKCLRFAGVVNNNNVLVKRRVNPDQSEQSSDGETSAPQVMHESGGSTEMGSQSQELVVEQTIEHRGPGDSQDFNLEVVLPFHQPQQPQSGVNLLLNENSLHDVEGFAASRDNPQVRILETAKLMKGQEELGFNFGHNLEEPRERMIGMEVRDRNEVVKGQESSRPQ
jgi:hypothetical protein